MFDYGSILESQVGEHNVWCIGALHSRPKQTETSQYIDRGFQLGGDIDGDKHHKHDVHLCGICIRDVWHLAYVLKIAGAVCYSSTCDAIICSHE